MVVHETLKENNTLRDAQFDLKLAKNNEKIFEHIQSVLKHNDTSPKTMEEINKINNTCNLRGAQIVNMGDDMLEIKATVKEIKKTVESLLTKTDKRYSPMAAWTIIKWTGSIIGGILLGSAIAHLFIDRK